MQIKDTLFKSSKKAVRPFAFNKKVAGVFDDMINRSVPYYSEVQEQTLRLLLDLVPDGCRIYDLGCATGNTLILLALGFKEAAYRDISIIGYDSSPAMCEEAERKLARYRINPVRIRIVACDILEGEIQAAEAVVMNYTLQFIAPELRGELLGRIYQGLKPGGVLIVSDKTLQSTHRQSELFLEHYHNYKRKNGYSDLEIARKREALEQVLIPYTLDEALALLRGCGFRAVDLFFSWYNFTSFICVK